MKLVAYQSTRGNVESQLKQLLLIEEQKQRFQGLVHNLAEICWETCIDTPSTRLEEKTSRCLVNCVDRFIDTTEFVTSRIKNTNLP